MGKWRAYWLMLLTMTMMSILCDSFSSLRSYHLFTCVDAFRPASSWGANGLVVPHNVSVAPLLMGDRTMGFIHGETRAPTRSQGYMNIRSFCLSHSTLPCLVQQGVPMGPAKPCQYNIVVGKPIVVPKVRCTAILLRNRITLELVASHVLVYAEHMHGMSFHAWNTCDGSKCVVKHLGRGYHLRRSKLFQYYNGGQLLLSSGARRQKPWAPLI